MKYKWLFAVLFIFCFMLALPASAEEMQEVTSKCSYYAGSGKKTFAQCKDDSYRTYWHSNGGENAYVEVTMPAEQLCGGVYIQWYETPVHWQIQTKDESGNWVTAAVSQNAYYNDYLSLPDGASVFRIRTADGVKEGMNVAELHIFTQGDKPDWVQVWQPTVEKADLMLIVAHPDDEVLWFGGALPTYAGQLQKKVLVCMLVPTMPYRRIELLDCLWTCGVGTYPVWGKFPDSYSSSLSGQYKLWNKDTLYKLIVGWYRQYKPNVVLTHDVKGEYGHGAHRACCDACIKALDLATNPKKFTDSYKQYGAWDVPKLYIHLYAENALDMDWRQPLSAFQGKTGFEVAEAAFKCHISQQKTDYHVEDWGKYDNSLFGLYRSLVGEDVNKNDFFENIE